MKQGHDIYCDQCKKKIFESSRSHAKRVEWAREVLEIPDLDMCDDCIRKLNVEIEMNNMIEYLNEQKKELGLTKNE